jgi:hypothetical protein
MLPFTLFSRKRDLMFIFFSLSLLIFMCRDKGICVLVHAYLTCHFYLCSCLQIGRSSESPIDFVVMDTIPGDKTGENKVLQSTISRFACRILCDRSNPRVARIYAAGFDSSRNIFLGVSASSALLLGIFPAEEIVALSSLSRRILRDYTDLCWNYIYASKCLYSRPV